MGKACPNQEVHAISSFGGSEAMGNLCPDMEGPKTFLFGMESHGRMHRKPLFGHQTCADLPIMEFTDLHMPIYGFRTLWKPMEYG